MSWFPIPEELLFDSEQFRQLPTTAKVLLALMSEANLRQGEFYRSDYEWAVRLKASTSTVYRARRELLPASNHANEIAGHLVSHRQQ